MFSCIVNDQTELLLLDRSHGGELFKLIDSNRDYLRRWHPWVDAMKSAGDVERAIASWQQLYSNSRGLFAGVVHNGRLCGMIIYLNVDRTNRWAFLGYWLDEAHQGKGLMTACCQSFISYGFETWNLNRVTIECAADNARSRAIPERLGFTLEGVTRGVEWLHDHYVNHAIYGLLRSEFADGNSMNFKEATDEEGIAAMIAKLPVGSVC